MKTQKAKLLVLSLFITSTLSMSGEARAFDFFDSAKNFYNSAKEALAEAKEKAQAAYEEQLKKREEENAIRAEKEAERQKQLAKEAQDRIIKNSIFNISGTVSSPDEKWLMVIITKPSDSKEEKDFKEYSTYKIEDQKYAAALGLRNGAGTYKVELFTSPTDRYAPSSKEERATYVNPYHFLKSITVENGDQEDNAFLLPSQHVQSQDERIAALAKEITDGSSSDEEAIRRITNYITANIKYDYDSYNDNSYLKKDYDAITVLDNRTGVCSGYSNLLAALARSVGIRTKIINGPAMGINGFQDHAWNEVYIDGEWKIIDSTWLVVYPNKYFFPSPEEFSKDHTKKDELLDY